MDLKIGTDIVNILRINKALQKFGSTFLDKILTPTEKEYCLKAPNSAIMAATVAKRFAAKEAFSKCLGLGIGNIVTFKDIWVSNQRGKPILSISNKVKSYIEDRFKTHSFILDLSLSDDTDYAVAFVVLLIKINNER